ncbi:B-cell receptor-associated protein 31 [Halichoerus grypus]
MEQRVPPGCHLLDPRDWSAPDTSLFFFDCSLLRRLVTLISQQATLLASNEAFKKQAESASEAAKKYMEENDQLKKEAAVGGVKLDGRDAEEKVEEENRSLKADLKKLKDELDINKQKLEKAENEALAMRKQSEGLTKEYDRLLEEHAKLQAAVDGPTDKKE